MKEAWKPDSGVGKAPRTSPPAHALVAKELRSYFVSPVVYVVGAVFLMIFGVLTPSVVAQRRVPSHPADAICKAPQRNSI